MTRSRCPAFQGPSLKMQQPSYRPRRSHILSRYKGERQVHKMSKTISVCVYYANPPSNLSMHVCTKGPLRPPFFSQKADLFRTCVWREGKGAGNEESGVTPGSARGKSVCLFVSWAKDSALFGKWPLWENNAENRRSAYANYKGCVPLQVCVCFPLPL